MERVALLITMYNEEQIVRATLDRVSSDFCYVGIVQSGDTPYQSIDDKITNAPMAAYELLPDLSEEYSRWELPAQALCRNFSKLFHDLVEAKQVHGLQCDYAVVITGDTLLLHTHGILDTIGRMQKAKCPIGISKATGNDFHSAEHTEEDMISGRGGGRLQGKEVYDFQPQLWIVEDCLFEEYMSIPVTNKWCSEQCIGDVAARTIGLGAQYVISDSAYGFADGVVYHAKANS